MGVGQLTKLLSRGSALVGTKPKAERPKPLRRYRQGDLDSLCGIYSVVNAVVALCPEVKDRAAMLLFRKLLRSLRGEVRRPIGLLYDGLDVGILEHLLLVAQGHTRKALGVEIEVRPFPGVRKHLTLAEFWDRARQELDEGQVAILCLSGAREHWTVADSATADQIRLRDSGGMRALQRERCTLGRSRVRYRIHPSECMLLKRKP